VGGLLGKPKTGGLAYAANSERHKGRDFAAWIGLVPRQHSTGGKDRLGGISNQGDRYLRACSSSVQHPLFNTPGGIRKNIPGSYGCWLGSRPSSSPLPLPTRWRASLGRSWPREDTIERRSLLQLPEEAWQWKLEVTVRQDNRIARVMMA